MFTPLTLSLVRSNCFTTTMSANRSTRVTELSSARPARTIAFRSLMLSSWPSSGSFATISHSRSIDRPMHQTCQRERINWFALRNGIQHSTIYLQFVLLCTHRTCLVLFLDYHLQLFRRPSQIARQPNSLIAQRVQSLAAFAPLTANAVVPIDVAQASKSIKSK